MITNIYEVTFRVEVDLPDQMNLLEVNNYINDKLFKMLNDNPEMLNMFDIRVRDLHRGRLTE